MIIRANHNAEQRFFLVRRATAQDARLTSRARGVLCYLLSKPDGWSADINNLKKEFPDLGRDAAYGVISELIQHGYAKRVQERDETTGTLGKVRIDVYEMPLTGFQEVESPLPALPDTAEPLPASPDTAKPEHINKQSAEKRQRQEKTEAAAKTNAAAAKSVFDLKTIQNFIAATKKGKSNPGGLAVYLQRTGEEDEQIRLWLDAQEKRKAASSFDVPWESWGREQAEREAEQQWLHSLSAEEYETLASKAAEEFKRRFPGYTKHNGWQFTHKGAIERLIITAHYEPEEVTC